MLELKVWLPKYLKIDDQYQVVWNGTLDNLPIGTILQPYDTPFTQVVTFENNNCTRKFSIGYQPRNCHLVDHSSKFIKSRKFDIFAHFYQCYNGFSSQKNSCQEHDGFIIQLTTIIKYDFSEFF